MIKELQKIEKVFNCFAQYSNAGGISDIESEKAILPRANKMLKIVAAIAKERSA